MTLLSFFSIKNIENTILWKLMVLSTKCKLELGVSHNKNTFYRSKYVLNHYIISAPLEDSCPCNSMLLCILEPQEELKRITSNGNFSMQHLVLRKKPCSHEVFLEGNSDIDIDCG